MQDALWVRVEEGMLQLAALVPRLLLALGLLMVGFAVAKMVEHGTDRGLRRVGFDRWMGEGGVSEALERAGTDLEPSTVLAKLMFWIVMLAAILLGADFLGLSTVSLFGELVAYVPNVIAAVVVLVIGIVLGEFVKDLVLASAGALHAAPTLARAAKGAIILLSIFMALEQLDIAQDIVLVSFVAVVGAAALAAGIAFGLGGREVAAEITRDWYERSKRARARAGQHRGTAGRRPPEQPPAAPPPFPSPPPGDTRE
ncbi:MAG: hypothetical protein WEA24_12645 [Gemmatimonadota bacterium]